MAEHERRNDGGDPNVEENNSDKDNVSLRGIACAFFGRQQAAADENLLNRIRSKMLITRLPLTEAMLGLPPIQQDPLRTLSVGPRRQRARIPSIQRIFHRYPLPE